MIKKRFRFRSMAISTGGGKADHKVEVFAPSVNGLKEKVARELAISKVKPSFSHVDRVEVDILDNGVISFRRMLIRRALDGNKFAEEVLKTSTYNYLTREKDL